MTRHTAHADMSTPECLPIVLAYIERDDRVLLARRPAHVHQGGRWEFPGGKVEPGETLDEALRREVREELGIAVAVGEEIACAVYTYPDRCVELHLLACAVPDAEALLSLPEKVCWAPAGKLDAYEFPPANAVLLQAISRMRAIRGE